MTSRLARARGLLEDAAVGARLLRRLPGYLRAPVDVPTARSVVERRLALRGDDFLALARATIFGAAGNPYAVLLRQAGCEYGDLAALVGRHGLEGALRILAGHGVYLTGDEYRGREPVVRGRVTIAVAPEDLRNPLASPAGWGRTGGSRGLALRVPVDLASSRDRAANTCLVFAARGGMRWRKAVWSTPGVGTFLRHAGFGEPMARWFSQVDPATPGLEARYGWSARSIRWISVLAGRPLPALEHVPLTDTRPIARWMAETLRAGAVPHLWAFPSSAVRLCRDAAAAGIDLTGAELTVTGEPVTAARLAAIAASGAHALPDYGSADSGGFIAYGCLAPEAPDDVHVMDDLNAVIRAAAPIGALPAGTLLVTSLRSSAPFVFFNVSLGDRAELGERRCGCPLEAVGWPRHLHTIRSYEKLTAGGATFLDSDVARILEETLPRRFGGGPTDYQLVEEESDDGRPRLRLLVHPAVGALDDGAVVDAFVHAVGAESGSLRVMALQWRQGGLLRVERRPPQTTGSGKILHLHGAGATPHRPAGDTPRETPSPQNDASESQ
jgi:hypothetical protein